MTLYHEQVQVHRVEKLRDIERQKGVVQARTEEAGRVFKQEVSSTL